MANANQVADYVLGKIDVEDGDSITHLKLQKLVYYCQARSLALYGKPLYVEPIEAWLHGPVVRSIWSRFSEYEWRAIAPSERDPNSDGVLTPAQRRLVDEVWEAYGHLSGSQLRHLTHEEEPWRAARGSLPPGARSSAEISRDSMRAFYRAKLAT